MPTGYTAKIKDGIEFNEFVMTCARAMGACVMMRDDPMDTPIPDEFKPSEFYINSVENARKELARLKSMTDDECMNESRAEHDKAKEYHTQGQLEDRLARERYASMLAKVKAWTPPTTEHEGLKDFMVQQIESSIKFDCNHDYHGEQLAVLKMDIASDWRAKKIAAQHATIQQYSKSAREEADRAKDRTDWVKALRDSLTPPVK